MGGWKRLDRAAVHGVFRGVKNDYASEITAQKARRNPFNRLRHGRRKQHAGSAASVSWRAEASRPVCTEAMDWQRVAGDGPDQNQPPHARCLLDGLVFESMHGQRHTHAPTQANCFAAVLRARRSAVLRGDR